MAVVFATASYADELHIRIENKYAAGFDLGFVGKGTRKGTDVVEGDLTQQPDGTWKGEVKADVDMNQELIGPLGATCPMTQYLGKQKLKVVAFPADGFSPAQTIAFDSNAGPGQRSGKQLALKFEAAEAPSFTLPAQFDETCVTLYQRTEHSFKFLPLNDTRWTEPRVHYIIELPESGLLVWTDDTVNPAQAESTPLAGFATADSHWKVRAERRD